MRGKSAGARWNLIEEATLGSVIRDPKLALEMMFTKSGKTLLEISTESGVDLKSLYYLRSRKYKRGPKIKTLEALAPVLGVEVERLREAIAGKNVARRQRERIDKT